MTLLLSLPGGTEWILIILLFSLYLLIPFAAIYFFVKSRRLKEELQRVTQEKNMLLERLLEKGI